MKFSSVALLGAASLAVAQPHNHAAHHHVAKRASPVEAREPSNVIIPGPTVTIYELNGQVISAEEVAAGIKSGKYILVGETLQSVSKAPVAAASTPAPAPSTSAAPKATSSAVVQPGILAEKKSSSSSVVEAKPTTTSAPSSSKVVASPSATASSSSGSGDVSSDFPSGTIPCSKFPAEYGAVALDWLNLGGWSGIQLVPDYTSIASSISTIHTATSGSGCTKNSFCSYACPAGYQKSQWPTAQGSTGQSIGGLYCNADGMLELSRPSKKQICTAGAGGVQVSNKLTQNVAICRTDYPGTESETIPLDTQPGGAYELTCPLASDYYEWEGKSTSAQYYINPAGVSVSDACQWGNAGSDMGNWAPLNMGVGKTSAGTFLSIFRNSPTNTDGSLDFTITISGDVSGKCVYKNNVFYNNGVVSPSGCTVSHLFPT